VKVAKLDRMLDLVGELAISRGRLDAQIAALGGAKAVAIQDAHRDLDRLFTELQEHVMEARLVPVGTLFQGYTRAVRDLALQTAKEIDLAIEGSEVEVDNAVVEQLREPLIHLIRNAVDHGIENGVERRAAGKLSCGHIRLMARHEAAFVIIEVADDGRGMVREKLVAQAQKWGGVEDVDRLSDADLQDLIFEPGFSTATKVTDLSGRGIGMDIVRRAVERLRGTISVKSVPGRGTTFTLRFPLTLAIIEGFGVVAGDESYVIPLESVVECVDLPAGMRGESEGTGVLQLRGEPLPYVGLEEHFRFGAGGAGRRRKVVVVRHGEGLAGIAVDDLQGECQAVIKPLSSLFKQTVGVSGSTILGSGRVALILDVPALLREAVARTSSRRDTP
jgi:two-component system chemotaxis sensor kinase CheA